MGSGVPRPNASAGRTRATRAPAPRASPALRAPPGPAAVPPAALPSAKSLCSPKHALIRPRLRRARAQGRRFQASRDLSPALRRPARPLALRPRRFRSTVGFRLPASGRFCEGSGLPAALRRPPLASRRAFYLFFYFAMLYLDLCFILRYLFISSCL